jgi:hypothetical protein
VAIRSCVFRQRFIYQAVSLRRHRRRRERLRRFERVTIPPRMNLTPQRDYWTGEQTELGEAWTLQKHGKVARCVLFSHLFGHELKLFIGDEFLRSQVCRSSERSFGHARAVESRDARERLACLIDGSTSDEMGATMPSNNPRATRAGSAKRIQIRVGRMTTARDRGCPALAATPTIRRECRKDGSRRSSSIPTPAPKIRRV